MSKVIVRQIYSFNCSSGIYSYFELQGTLYSQQRSGGKCSNPLYIEISGYALPYLEYPLSLASLF